MSQRHPKPYDSVLELIGWTPMVRLQRVHDGSVTPLYAKCEFFGPGGYFIKSDANGWAIRGCLLP